MPVKTAKPGKPIILRSASDTKKEKIELINQEFKERDIKKLAKSKGMPYINLKNIPLNQDALNISTWDEVQKSNVLPFDLKGNELSLATSLLPDHSEVVRVLNAYEEKGYHVKIFLVSDESLFAAKRYYDQVQVKEELKLPTVVEENQTLSNLFSRDRSLFEHGNGPEMLNALNLAAVSFLASDIHFEPNAQDVKVRMRRDGELYEALTLSLQQYHMLGSEIKRLAGLKINLNAAQDGSYLCTVNSRQINVRVSSLPSQFGETFVLRILDPKALLKGVEALGFSEHNKSLLRAALQKNRGLIIVTGPTGSGKTSTLYASLLEINSPEKNMVSLEDPIEYTIPGVTQSEIHEADGYSFATALRSVLRQDPDVIMVGEMRDQETAEISFQASLTGHLVLSTLHSNDAISTVQRLLNMGIKADVLGSGLSLIIAQRLVRKICTACQGKKCENCAQTGFKGRMAVAEVLPITEAMKSLIASGAQLEKISEQAKKEGFVTMLEDAEEKVKSGVTTAEEIVRSVN